MHNGECRFNRTGGLTSRREYQTTRKQVWKRLFVTVMSTFMLFCKLFILFFFYLSFLPISLLTTYTIYLPSTLIILYSILLFSYSCITSCSSIYFFSLLPVYSTFCRSPFSFCMRTVELLNHLSLFNVCGKHVLQCDPKVNRKVVHTMCLTVVHTHSDVQYTF